ncbi:hypothetical protein [Vibrio breoganii]|uniref:SIR2-like domain-containing protein n=1 Tax=Vibrio breoganii TaxID=553239 RepID=A0ABX1U5W2_9VIBR|nr:hypothetical protein [Vibrio breoganii]NMO71869.1 hypothetical protein [Vibrio breoganii]NMR68407.1 hypothetical protein [Vibrio breoganii]PML89336.1 hypothetical protein BCT67_08150 [Vibrio breoganii]
MMKPFSFFTSGTKIDNFLEQSEPALHQQYTLDEFYSTWAWNIRQQCEKHLTRNSVVRKLQSVTRAQEQAQSQYSDALRQIVDRAIKNKLATVIYSYGSSVPDSNVHFLCPMFGVKLKTEDEFDTPEYHDQVRKTVGKTMYEAAQNDLAGYYQRFLNYYASSAEHRSFDLKQLSEFYRPSETCSPSDRNYFSNQYLSLAQLLVKHALTGSMSMFRSLEDEIKSHKIEHSQKHIEAIVYFIYRCRHIGKHVEATISAMKIFGLFTGEYSENKEYVWNDGLKEFNPEAGVLTDHGFVFDRRQACSGKLVKFGQTIEETVAEYKAFAAVQYYRYAHHFPSVYSDMINDVDRDAKLFYEIYSKLAKYSQEPITIDKLRYWQLDLQRMAAFDFSRLCISKAFYELIDCCWTWILESKKPANFNTACHNIFYDDKQSKMVLLNHILQISKAIPVASQVMDALCENGYVFFERTNEGELSPVYNAKNFSTLTVTLSY